MTAWYTVGASLCAYQSIEEARSYAIVDDDTLALAHTEWRTCAKDEMPPTSMILMCFFSGIGVYHLWCKPVRTELVRYKLT